jgi:hypothetical protein
VFLILLIGRDINLFSELIYFILLLPPTNSIVPKTIKSCSPYVPPSCAHPFPPPSILGSLVGCCVLIQSLAMAKATPQCSPAYLATIQSPLQCLPYCSDRLSVDCWVSRPNSSHQWATPLPSLYLFVAPFADQNDRKHPSDTFLPSHDSTNSPTPTDADIQLIGTLFFVQAVATYG